MSEDTRGVKVCPLLTEHAWEEEEEIRPYLERVCCLANDRVWEEEEQRPKEVVRPHNEPSRQNIYWYIGVGFTGFPENLCSHS